MSNFISLASAYPELLEEWDYEKNSITGLNPEKIGAHSVKRAHWICSKDNRHTWDTRIVNRSKYKSNCHVCLNQKIVYGVNDFYTLNPSLMEEWDYTKNNHLGVNPKEISYNSNEKVYWICKRHHSFMSRIRNRRKGRGCVECHYIDLKKSYGSEKEILLTDDLIYEWDYGKNSEIGLYLENILPSSHKKAYWRCNNNHSYQLAIFRRTNNRQGCTECSKPKYYINGNDFASNFPELLKEWDYEKNNKLEIFPNKIARFSSKKVYWKCKKDHEWTTELKSRTLHNTNCKKCYNSNQNSKIEETIMSKIEIKSGKVKTLYDCYKSGNIAQCDGIDTKNKIVVEYDGHYWHKDRSDVDTLKTQALIDSGYTVIRIREKKLPSLKSKISRENYYEILDVYPYGTQEKVRKEIGNIVNQLNTIISQIKPLSVINIG